ncbi:LOW QUALITY PROTEIN: thromboxane-A synthase-like [Dermacentor silvarum]|uniref:LOW QUALITY PROTEIN: thromboxane-A synthase-like n=1 Tax=Dermacentor silvarum TaxID=543639 RepID=UPI00189B5596|nr:LOW QUALITY PROTEIN: thromboxane-A synthase-like [Dermacentor silvarum]
MWELVVATVVLFIVHWLMKRREHFNFFKYLGIPGPTPNIIFGNMLEMYKKSPVKAYREWIDKYGDVVGYFNGYRPVILMADLDLLKQIQIKDFQDFVDRGLLFQAKRPPSPHNKGLLQLTSTRWKEVRSVLTPSFTTNKLKMMSPGVISAVEKLVSKFDHKAETGEEFEVGDMYAALALDVICKSAMGIDYNLQDHPRHGFLVCCRMLFGCAFSFIAVLLTAFPGSAALLKFINSRWLRYQNSGVHPFIEVQEKCKRIVGQRQQDTSLRQKDLLQLMIDAKESRVDLGSVTSTQLTAGEENEQELPNRTNTTAESANGNVSVFNKAVLDDDDITQNAFVVLVAGFETTSNTMSLVTHMLVHYPEVQEKMREELFSVLASDEPITYNTIQKLTYMNCVIQETIRMYPPAFAFVTREAVVNKEYGKIRIPAGTAVMAAVEYIHRDPRHWENPDKFDPDRFLPENKSRINTMAMQGFGSGPRNCIGMRFAHMELRYTFAHILRKYRLEKTENSERDPPNIEMNPIILKIKNGVKVRAVPL